MNADQIIQTARLNLARLIDRSRDRAAELTRSGQTSEDDAVRMALQEGVRSVEAVQEQLMQSITSDQEQEPTQ